MENTYASAEKLYVHDLKILCRVRESCERKFQIEFYGTNCDSECFLGYISPLSQLLRGFTPLAHALQLQRSSNYRYHASFMLYRSHLALRSFLSQSCSFLVAQLIHIFSFLSLDMNSLTRQYPQLQVTSNNKYPAGCELYQPYSPPQSLPFAVPFPLICLANATHFILLIGYQCVEFNHSIPYSIAYPALYVIYCSHSVLTAFIHQPSFTFSSQSVRHTHSLTHTSCRASRV